MANAIATLAQGLRLPYPPYCTGVSPYGASLIKKSSSYQLHLFTRRLRRLFNIIYFSDLTFISPLYIQVLATIDSYYLAVNSTW